LAQELLVALRSSVVFVVVFLPATFDPVPARAGEVLHRATPFAGSIRRRALFIGEVQLHFLKEGELYGAAAIERRRACVTVRYVDGKLWVQDGIGVTKMDAIFVELPERIAVVDDKGKRIKATGRFLVSTETFNPFHLVVDMF
jgi:hypothetical protein